LNASKSDTKQRGKRYHHGNLRDALIIAAAELIEENASIDFAIVDAAHRAGVSNAAPYRHFKDKHALLEAVSELGFLGLTETVRASANSKAPGSNTKIIALGRTYIRFVIKHRAFYDLMWGDMGLRGIDVADTDIKTSGFYVLVEAVQELCDKQNLSDYDVMGLAVNLWAMAHGLACLSMNHQLEKFLPDVDVYGLLETSTETFLEGLQRANPKNEGDAVDGTR
jgi:AcrR family transcriptional regulator